MQIDVNYDHKFFTVFSGYRAEEELHSTLFSVDLTQPLLDVREIKLDYAQFSNCIVPYADTAFFWSEYGYSSSISTLAIIALPTEFTTPNQLMAYIEEEMNDISPHAYTYTVTIDAVTGKITWTSTGNFTIYCTTPLEGVYGVSAYYLGLASLADGRQVYPGIPRYFTPEGTTYTSYWPVNLRDYGIAIRVRPWTADTCSNSDYLDNHLFVIPLGKTNYGEVVEYNQLSSWKQNIAFFKPGHSFKRLYFSIVKLIDVANDAVALRLSADILLRFSYTTYRDTEALSQSINLTA
jgi:hypothetical protein